MTKIKNNKSNNSNSSYTEEERAFLEKYSQGWELPPTIEGFQRLVELQHRLENSSISEQKKTEQPGAIRTLEIRFVPNTQQKSADKLAERFNKELEQEGRLLEESKGESLHVVFRQSGKNDTP